MEAKEGEESGEEGEGLFSYTAFTDFFAFANWISIVMAVAIVISHGCLFIL